MRPWILPLMLASLAACAASCNSKPGTGGSNPEKPVLRFDHEQITEFVISKNDPNSGDHWSLRLTRPEPKSADWKIASGPDSRVLTDTRADGIFISHLLDTLGTLQAVSKAPEGPASSFGLERPLFALRWNGTGLTGEVRIGDSDVKAGGAWALFGSNTQVWLAQGAALQMLSRLETFEALRQRKFVTLEADDIDEIQTGEVYRQRAGDRWADRKNKPQGDKHSAEFTDRLNRFVHTRVLRFVDDSEKIAGLLLEIRKKSAAKVDFKDRRGNLTAVRIIQTGNGTFGWISSRGDVVFELYPQSMEFFKSSTH